MTPDLSSDDLCVVFAGGGSGGHIFPSLAIAEQLLEQSPQTTTRFIISRRPLDAKILQQSGETGSVILAEPFGTKPKTFLRFATHWGRAVREARRVLSDCQRNAEHVVLVTVGGYVAAPAARAARAQNIPIVLVNLDAVPGKANTLIARKAAATCTTSSYQCPANWTSVRPIVRNAAHSTQPVSTCRALLGLDTDMPVLFITGASQGARSINQFMKMVAQKQPEILQGWQVFHQTGAYAVEAVAQAYAQADIPAKVVEFVDDMASAWRAADLAVCRSGANTVAEAWANRVPAILMPYPYHRDQHQKYNAEPLVQAGAAVLCQDHIQAQANLADAGEKLASLLADRAARESMHDAFESLGPADGAATIAGQILALSRPPA